MSKTVSSAFKQYAFFSVQVDQYLNATKVFAWHYDSLKSVYKHLPTREDWPTNLDSLTEKARVFFLEAAHTLNYMGATNIFADAPYAELSDLPNDILNFGFYTCYCFQWTLFENFVKERVLGLANDGLLTPTMISALNGLRRRTRDFLKYIDDGHVFGRTPFQTVLPVPGWTMQMETCTFVDLDEIRERRNHFIHGISSPSIRPIGETNDERVYMRSMHILRNFATNLDQDVETIRNP
jgi:hypothetical protein